MIPDTEFRFDRVTKAHVFPALLWEAARDATTERLHGGGLVWIYLKSHPNFPSVPWLELKQSTRDALAKRFSPSFTRAQDGAELLYFHTSNFPQPSTADAWRDQLARMGCVVLDLGSKGRYTRAELVGRFEAWLDASPDWITQKKRSPSHGRRTPDDGLRAIAWRRVFRWFSTQKTKADPAAVLAITQMVDFKAWMRLPTTQPKRSKLSKEAELWCQRIVIGN